MAMLAEPRRKQKWTLNPRGKQWSEDSNKFGQKMLEKMGWTSGRGLGANEQGMTEHVKVSYKNNQSGIGFKDTGNQWTQHQADFNDFLSQLQEQNSNSDTSAQIKANQVEKNESLELKSKRSRSRVHYHKFTRGKDVKKYSSKDLANIFGKKELREAMEASKAEEAPEEAVAEPAGSKDITGGVLTIKGGNIDEYFKNKLPHFMRKGSSRETEDSEGEYEPRLGFGFSNENPAPDESKNSGFAFTNGALDLDYQEERRDSKKKKNDFAYDNPTLSQDIQKESVKICTIPFSNEGFVNPALNLNDLLNEKNNGAEFEVSRVAFGLDNDALDLSDENGRKKRVTFNDKVEYNTDVIKKKKKKGKGKLDKFEVDNSKLKKKLKESEIAIEAGSGCDVAGFVNEALDVEVINEEVNDNELNERKTKKSKRKKNRRESNLETIQEIAEENSQVIESEVGEAILLDETPPKKNKKLKKIPESDNSLESAEAEAEALGTKKKDKKVKKSQEAEITVLTEISRKISKAKKNKVTEESQSLDTQPEVIEVKRKSKRRSKSKLEEKEEASEIKSEEISEVEVPNTNVATKRKSSDRENVGTKPSKRSKLDKPMGTENTENIQQNGGFTVNTSSPVQYERTGRKSKKTFKSLFTKAPTLYFSGSNINEMAGYGASIMEQPKKQDRLLQKSYLFCNERRHKERKSFASGKTEF